MRPARLLLCALLAASVRAAAAAEPDGLDRVVLNGVLSAAAVTAPGRQEVWPGYDMLSQPVLLYRDNGVSFLIAHPSPPAGFRPYPSEIFPRARVHVSTEPLPDVLSVFYTAYPLGGLPVFAIRYGESDSPVETVSTAVHERFHVAQDGLDGSTAAFKNMYSGRDLYPADIAPENMALAAMEEILLARALLDGRNDLEAVKDLISVRLLRRGSFGRRWALLDDDLERSEGIAEYVTGRIEELASADGGEFTPETLAYSLLRVPGPEEAAEHMLHGRQYTTGAALALLLDRRVPGWKRRAAGGEYPFEILLQAVPVPAAERRARVKALKKELNYGAKLKYAGYALSGALEAMRNDNNAFLAHAGPRLLVRALHTGETKVSYHSRTAYDLNERTELFVENPLYEFANGDVQLLVKDSTLQVYTDKDGYASIQVLLSSAPAVYAGGKPAVPAPAPEEMREVLVEAPGVTLRARKAMVQSVDGIIAVDVR